MLTSAGHASADRTFLHLRNTAPPEQHGGAGSGDHVADGAVGGGGGGGENHLRWLVRRIADDDRDAFVEFFDRLAGPVSTALHRQVSDPVQVAGVVAGTFVDSRAFAPLPDFAAATSAVPTSSWAERVEAELAALLTRRLTP
jgi:hypothetical protein